MIHPEAVIRDILGMPPEPKPAHVPKLTVGTHAVWGTCDTCPASLESYGTDESSRSFVAAWVDAHGVTS